MAENANNNTKDMTEGSPARLILFFTLPLIAGNIFQQLYGFVDTLIVGRFLGVEALAAVGCTGCLMFLLVGCIMGMTAGLTIITGQRFGARDYEGLRGADHGCQLRDGFYWSLFCPGYPGADGYAAGYS